MHKYSPGKGLLTLFAFLVVSVAFAQNYTAAETKSIEKSKTLYNKGKYDKAISTINKVLFAHIHDEDLWGLRVTYEYQRYEVQYSADISAIVKKAGKKGTVTVDFSKLKSTTFRSEMIFACYMATLYADHQNLASSVLHDQLVEPTVDTTIGDEAHDYKYKGDEELGNGNYSAAIRQYQKAVDEDSTYYTAVYDIAFCYYKDEKYEQAEKWYSRASRLQPEMLNPRYFLVECYINDKNWDAAYAACIEGMIAYPFNGYFDQMEKICDKKDKTFKRHWMERDYLPSIVTVNNQSGATDEPWSFYAAAKDKIMDYCNDDGIITKSQTMTEQKYLETYSWEYMLKKSDTDEKEFGFAHKQQEVGNLDCYALFSMFHVLFWEQYKDFRDKNHDRLKSYIEAQLIK